MQKLASASRDVVVGLEVGRRGRRQSREGTPIIISMMSYMNRAPSEQDRE